MRVDLDEVRRRLDRPTVIDGEDWQRVRERVRAAVGESVFAIWLEPLQVVAVDRDGVLVLRVGRRVRILRRDPEALLAAGGTGTPQARLPNTSYTAEQFWDAKPHPGPDVRAERTDHPPDGHVNGCGGQPVLREGQMATTTDVLPQVRMIALEEIRHDANVRELSSEDVDALAGSIALLGQITPAIVRPDGDAYVLVAGHKRYAALQKLGHAEIGAEVRSGDGEHSERAANIVRTQLNPRRGRSRRCSLTG